VTQGAQPRAPVAAPGLPFLANAVDLLRDPLAFFLRMYQDLGPVYTVGGPGRRYVVLAGPEANRRFLEWDHRHFSSGPVYRPYQDDLGTEDVLIAMDGDQHRRYRKQLKAGFSREALAPHLPHMVAAVDRYLDRLEPGAHLNVTRMLQFLVAEQGGIGLAGCPMGRHFDDVKVFAHIFLGAGVGAFPGFMRSLPRYRRARGRVLRMLREGVERHRRGEADGRLPDLIDLLLQVTPRGRPLSEVEILAQAHAPYTNTLVYVAAACGFLLYRLLADPELLASVREEVDTLFAEGAPDPALLRHSPWLRGSLLETHRMHPIAISVPRYVERSFEFQGHRIEAGQMTLTATAVTHFLPELFPEPRSFDPSRHLPPRNEHRQGGALVPFGLGSHVCLAAGMVDLLVLLTVGRLIQRLDLALEPADYVLGLSVAPFPAPSRDFTVRLVGRRRAPPRLRSPGVFEPGLAALLPDVEPDVLAAVARGAVTGRYGDGTVILKQGDPAAHFHVLTSGTVEVVKEDGRGVSTVLARLGAGDYFGEIGLLHGVPRTATVRAVGDVETIVLDGEGFRRLVEEADFTSGEIATVVRQRLVHTALAVALPDLPRERIEAAWPGWEWLSFAPGTDIVRQGGASDRFYLIVRGEVDVVNEHPDGRERLVCSLGGGDYFGEIGILQDRPRTATVRAGPGPVEVLALDREAFLALLAESPSSEGRLAQEMAWRLRELAGQAGGAE
jgi:cytochrome P450/CRP-like cAMP-binding protein